MDRIGKLTQRAERQGAACYLLPMFLERTAAGYALTANLRLNGGIKKRITRHKTEAAALAQVEAYRQRFPGYLGETPLIYDDISRTGQGMAT